LNQRDLPWMESEMQFSDFVQSLRELVLCASAIVPNDFRYGL
jgi:hypothetical protein